MKKTRLLFVTRSYWPDIHTGGPTLSALCEGLAEEFEVEVISGRSNDVRKHRRSIVGLVRQRGVTIHRLLHTTFSEPSMVGNLVNRATFAVATFLAILWRSPHPDIVIVQSNPPCLLLLGRFIKWRYRIPFVAHLQDYSSSQMFPSYGSTDHRVTQSDRPFSMALCNHADRIVVASKSTDAHCTKEGISKSRIEMIPNTANVHTSSNGSYPLTLSSLKYRLATKSSPNSLMKIAQTEMSVPPGAPDALRKVDQTFLSGQDAVVFQQAAKALSQTSAVGLISRPIAKKATESLPAGNTEASVVSMLAELIGSHDDSVRQQTELSQWTKLLKALVLLKPTAKADPR